MNEEEGTSFCIVSHILLHRLNFYYRLELEFEISCYIMETLNE